VRTVQQPDGSAPQGPDPDEAAYVWVRAPEGCRISFDVPVSFSRSEDGGWQKYYFSGFNYDKGLTAKATFTLETPEIRKVESQTLEGPIGKRYFTVDFNWSNPKITDLVRERKELAYKTAVARWKAWQESQELKLTSLSKNFYQWHERQLAVAEAEEDPSLKTALIGELKKHLDAFQEREQIEVAELTKLGERILREGETSLELPSDASSVQASAEQRFSDLSSFNEKEVKVSYAAFARREKLVSDYRVKTLIPWQGTTSKTINQWHESATAKFLTAPQESIAKNRAEYEKVLTGIDDPALRKRMELKLEEQFSKRSEAVNDLNVAAEIGAHLQFRNHLAQTAFDSLVAELRETGKSADAAVARSNREQAEERATREALEKKWTAQIAALTKKWNAWPKPEQLLAQQKLLLTQFKSVEDRLRADTAEFVKRWQEPLPIAETTNETLYIQQSQAIVSFKGKLVIEELTQRVEAEWKGRRAKLAQRRELVEKELARRQEMNSKLSTLLFSRLEEGTDPQTAMTLCDERIKTDEDNRRAFADAIAATFWDEKAFEGVVALGPKVSAQYPRALKLPKSCGAQPLKLNRDGLIELYPNQQPESAAMLTFQRGDLIDWVCDGESSALLLAKTESNSLAAPLSTESNRTLEDLKTAKENSNLLVIIRNTELTLLYGPELVDGRLTRLWKHSDGRLMALEKESEAEYFHSFSMDGQGHDIVDAVPVPEPMISEFLEKL